MDSYRRFSALAYGAAALVSAVLLLLTSFTSILVVGLTIAIAAAADRFINREAEPDERMRSFAVYVVGGMVGLLVILMFGSHARLGDVPGAAPRIRPRRCCSTTSSHRRSTSRVIRIGTASRRR